MYFGHTQSESAAHGHISGASEISLSGITELLCIIGILLTQGSGGVCTRFKLLANDPYDDTLFSMMMLKANLSK